MSTITEFDEDIDDLEDKLEITEELDERDLMPKPNSSDSNSSVSGSSSSVPGSLETGGLILTWVLRL